jgi:prolyl-tRNA editing enzyme YbaK/EbsC (Cys-tRNA(Pro) deacylase)
MKNILNKFNIDYEIINHPMSGKTTLDAKKALSVPSKNILKSLLFKSKKGNYLGVILRGDKKANVKKIETYFYEKYGDNRFKKLRMANNNEVNSLLGYDIGGVPPTAFFNICEVICDDSLLNVNFVIGAGGTQYSGLKINPLDLKKIYNNWGDDEIFFHE